LGSELKALSLVQASWAKVAPIKEVAGKLFYDNLFEGSLFKAGRKMKLPRKRLK
jgi:hypothetical protein